MEPKDDLPNLPEDEGKEGPKKGEAEEPELEMFRDLVEAPEEDKDKRPEKIQPTLEEVRTLRKTKVPPYPMFIGRDKKMTMCIPDPSISRRHTKIFERNAVYWLQDLGSINGTYLNDRRILDPVELKDGDRIKIAVTKQHPRGIKEFIFHFPNAQLLQEQQEQDALMKEVAGVKVEAGPKKVLLRHCTFKATRQNIMSVLVSESTRRVAMNKLDLPHKILYFQTSSPFKVKDTLVFSIEHPRLTEALALTVRVVNIVAVAEFDIQEHQTEILKFSDKYKAIYDSIIKPSALICYLTSTLKE